MTTTTIFERMLLFPRHFTKDLFSLKGIIIMISVLIFILFLFSSNSVSSSSINTKKQADEELSWKSIDLKSQSIPAGIIEKISKNSCFKLSENRVIIDSVDLFYREATPNDELNTGKTVLLLHGAAFTSATWINSIKTMQTLACLGHRVIAVDLPGYGKTKNPAGGYDKKEFLANVIDNFDVTPIVISPSMSGSFSLPLLVNHPELIRGFVPVAPVSTGNYVKDFPSIKVPTMIVYGDQDKSLGLSSFDNLKEIPTSTQPQILKDSGHPAYLDQPDIWHQLLHNFLLLLR